MSNRSLLATAASERCTRPGCRLCGSGRTSRGCPPMTLGKAANRNATRKCAEKGLSGGQPPPQGSLTLTAGTVRCVHTLCCTALCTVCCPGSLAQTHEMAHIISMHAASPRSSRTQPDHASGTIWNTGRKEGPSDPPFLNPRQFRSATAHPRAPAPAGSSAQSAPPLPAPEDPPK